MRDYGITAHSVEGLQYNDNRVEEKSAAQIREG